MSHRFIAQQNVAIADNLSCSFTNKLRSLYDIACSAAICIILPACCIHREQQ
ncbi:hypothetical protein [Brunnivagina elsteri]|uniref:hypothetical protein n=1 Tax=Brunnivagina elsteri TaxID=1247191 RepID=UPI001B8059DD|nr:hypothetical protein [Calothrix elsteri]